MLSTISQTKTLYDLPEVWNLENKEELMEKGEWKSGGD